MVIVILLVIILSAFSCEAKAQRQLSLDETITLARMQSVDAAVALNELKTAYWEYRTHRADMLPEVSFKGHCLPIIKAIVPISKVTDHILLCAITLWDYPDSFPLIRMFG
jgi:hypothetical protein